MLRVYTGALLLFLWCEQRCLLLEDIFVGLGRGILRLFFPLFPLDRYAWVWFDVLCFVLGLSRVSLVAKSQVIFMVCFVVLSY
jgi:hypothetical protein